MRYILAHDLGTSGNKATLFDEDGKLVGSEVYAYGTRYFNETWVEQDPTDWWKAVCQTSRSLIARTGIDRAEIAVVSFSGQMMGCLCVDDKGRPLRPSIIWADQRAQAQQRALAEKIPMDEYYRISGQRNTANYGIHKLMWVRDNEPDVYANTKMCLNAKDYIISLLTGNYYTEPSDGSSTAALDMAAFDWSDRILDATGLDRAKLPPVVPSTFVAGTVTRWACEETGIKEGTPVVMGGGDGACSNVGAGSVHNGQAFSYVGSSAWIASTSDTPLIDPMMRTFTWAHVVPGKYAPNGTMQSGGGAYNWLKSTVCVSECERAAKLNVSPYDLINQQVAESPVGANGVIFLPYLLGERSPRWSADARAAFVGLKMENERKDMLRAVLEGVTMNLAIVLDVLRQDAPIEELLVIGGGAKGAVWRQMMADVYDATVKVPKLLEEATSMGAAVAGGVGVGLFKDFDAIERFIEIERVVEPDPKRVKAYKPVREMFDEVYDALRPVYARMAMKG